MFNYLFQSLFGGRQQSDQRQPARYVPASSDVDRQAYDNMQQSILNAGLRVGEAYLQRGFRASDAAQAATDQVCSMLNTGMNDSQKASFKQYIQSHLEQSFRP